MDNARLEAQRLASYGRYGDTMLLHVNPAELAGLASLVPLTVNPVTGLPEAFLPFLMALFGGTAPAAAAATAGAAAAAPALAAAAAPALAGLGTAAGTAAAAAPALTAAAAPALTAAATPAVAQLASAAPLAAATTPAVAQGLGALPGAAGAIKAATLPTVAQAAPAAALGKTAALAGKGLASLPGVDPLITGSTGARAGQAAANLARTIPPLQATGPGASPLLSIESVAEQPLLNISSADSVAQAVNPGRVSLMQPSGGTPISEGVDFARRTRPIVADPGNPGRVSLTQPSGPMPPSEGASYARSVAAGAPEAGSEKGILGGAFDWLKKNPMMAAMGLQALGSMFKGGKKDKKGKPGKLRKYEGGEAVMPGEGYVAGYHGEHDYFPQARYAFPYANNGGLISLAKGGLVRPRGYAVGGPIDLQAQKPHDLSFPLNGVPGAAGLESLTGPEEIPTSPFPTEQIGTEPSPASTPEGEPAPEATVDDDQELIMQVVEIIKGKPVPNAEAVITAFVQAFGEGALQDLAQRVKATGGVESTGTSDSIPIMASEGEYMVPADAVSGLGNGSTQAGAQQLDGMVDNIRMARGGSPMQPPPIRGGIAAMMGGGLIA